MPLPNNEGEADPFAALEQAAERQAAEELSLKNIVAARAKLVLTNKPEAAFFAVLALQMEVKNDWTVPTMATDGDSLFVNPKWNNGLSPEERVGVVCHEVLHLSMAHHCRRQGRDAQNWNIGADLAINQIIEQAGFKLPKCRLMPGEGPYKDFPKEASAEEYYGLLSQPKQKKGGSQDEQGKQGSGKGSPQDGDGDGANSSSNGNSPGGTPPTGPGKPNGNSDPGGCGQILDAKDPAAAKDQEAKWAVATAQAEQASKSRGELGGGLARLVNEVVRPAADWKDILREFVQSRAKNDYSWSRPNRRFIADNLYLPGLFSNELGEVVIAIDTSGSIGKAQLDLFGSEVSAILGAFECSATILYHDAAITKVEEWTSSDGPLELKPVGGGGTSHIPIFEHVETIGISPTCIICLTDCHTRYPSEHPNEAVLWAVIANKNASPPFGQVVHIQGA